MVFQDPMTSLNPVLEVGFQIGEAITATTRTSRARETRKRAIELLELWAFPNPEPALRPVPARVLRRNAAASHDRDGHRELTLSVLIADEPTTALDVTIQAQIIEVLKTAQRRDPCGDRS